MKNIVQTLNLSALYHVFTSFLGQSHRNGKMFSEGEELVRVAQVALSPCCCELDLGAAELIVLSFKWPGIRHIEMMNEWITTIIAGRAVDRESIAERDAAVKAIRCVISSANKISISILEAYYDWMATNIEEESELRYDNNVSHAQHDASAFRTFQTISPWVKCGLSHPHSDAITIRQSQCLDIEDAVKCFLADQISIHSKYLRQKNNHKYGKYFLKRRLYKCV